MKQMSMFNRLAMTAGITVAPAPTFGERPMVPTSNRSRAFLDRNPTGGRVAANRRTMLLAPLLVMWAVGAQSQSEREPLRTMPSEAPTPLSSYEARILKRKDVHDVDPNIYAYTAEFAKRFQMPEQWIAQDLKGAEAVAFRVMPGYKSCGWGGHPDACKEDEVRCMLDVYFDHGKQSLPWDERMPSRKLDSYLLSSNFIAPGSYLRTSLARPKTSFSFFTDHSPFTDPQTGKGLGWQGGYWHSKNEYGGSFVGLRAYDREIFVGISIAIFGTACNGKSVPQSLWLSNENLGYLDREKSNHVVTLPADWQIRVREALTPYDQRNRAFYRKEGEKALKALQEKPVPQAPIIPLR